MRRLKKSSAERDAPTAKVPAFSRKKARFSGKKRLKPREVHLLVVHFRLREIVFTVKSSVRLWLMPILASPPIWRP